MKKPKSAFFKKNKFVLPILMFSFGSVFFLNSVIVMADGDGSKNEYVKSDDHSSDYLPYPSFQINYSELTDEDFKSIEGLDLEQKRMVESFKNSQPEEIIRDLKEYNKMLQMYIGKKTTPAKFAANNLATLIKNTTEEILNDRFSIEVPNIKKDVKEKLLDTIERRIKLLATLRKTVGSQFDKQWNRQKEKVNFSDYKCINDLKLRQEKGEQVDFNECGKLSLAQMEDQIQGLNQELQDRLENSAVEKIEIKEDAESCSVSNLKVNSNSQPEIKSDATSVCDITKIKPLMKSFAKKTDFTYWSNNVIEIGECDRVTVRWSHDSEGLKFAEISVHYPDKSNPEALSDKDKVQLIKLLNAKNINVQGLEDY